MCQFIMGSDCLELEGVANEASKVLKVPNLENNVFKYLYSLKTSKNNCSKGFSNIVQKQTFKNVCPITVLMRSYYLCL